MKYLIIFYFPIRNIFASRVKFWKWYLESKKNLDEKCICHFYLTFCAIRFCTTGIESTSFGKTETIVKQHQVTPEKKKLLKEKTCISDWLHKKWSFQLRISSVNVTKSAGNCGFGHIYWRIPHFLCSDWLGKINLIIVLFTKETRMITWGIRLCSKFLTNLRECR